MYIYIYIYGQGPHHVPLYIWSRRSYRTRRTQSHSYGGRTAVYAMDDAVAQLSHESIPLVFSPLRAASKPRRLRPATPGFECALYRFVTRYFFVVLARGESRPEAI
jgi:hypothetical protein